MYCPTCFTDNLMMDEKGIVNITINSKKLDNGRFMFNKGNTKEEIIEEFHKKTEDFFKWYSRFQNAKPIEKLELTSNAFHCLSGCAIEGNRQFSVIDALIPKEDVLRIFKQLGIKYNLQIDLKLD